MDICRFKYDKERDLFLEDVWIDDVTDDIIRTSIKSCLSVEITIPDSHPTITSYSNKVILIKDEENMSVFITFEGAVREAMYKLWTCGMKDFETLINEWFKEYFDNQVIDVCFDVMDIAVFLNSILIEAYSVLSDTESKDMEWIVDVLSGVRNVDKHSSDNKEEEKKDMNENTVTAITFCRSVLGGICKEATIPLDTKIAEGIEPNTAVLHRTIFNDSHVRFTVYIDSKLYDQFDKLLDKGPFFDRFVGELGKMEFNRNNSQETRKSSLVNLMQNIFISLGDVILAQKKANEKNAVLYLTDIQNKTESLLKAMELDTKEDPNPVEPKVEEYRKGKIDMINKHPYSKNMFKPQSILSKVYETGNRIKNDRNISGIFMQAVSEIGELGEEVRIKTDKSYYRKDEGKDGILGESCDTIIALTDLLNIAGYTLEDIDRVISSKLNKWEQKANDNKVMIHITKCEGDVGNFDYVKMYNDVNGKEARICKLSSHMYLVINYDSGKILGSAIYERFDKFVEFVKNCNIGDVANPSMLAKEIVDMLDRKGE